MARADAAMYQPHSGRNRVEVAEERALTRRAGASVIEARYTATACVEWLASTFKLKVIPRFLLTLVKS